MFDRIDVVLVYPLWVEGAGIARLQRMLPPLGILSIASFLESKNYTVRVIDVHAQALAPEQFRQRIKELRPRWLGITVLSSHHVSAHYIAAIAKEEIPDVKVCVGGVHAEAHHVEMLSNPFIDYVARGDGEELMGELLRGDAPETIAGLCYRKQGHIQVNPMRPVEMNLDKFPPPAYHLIDFKHYFPPAGTYRDLPAMNLVMTRGCPGKCNFCNSANTVLRSRSARSMVAIIKQLRELYQVRQLYFYDDTFTAVPGLVEEFCQTLIDAKLDVTWVCYIRGDMFRESLAKLMARAGCHQVLIGIETGSPQLMRELGKPIDVRRYREAVTIAHRHGIEVRASFIIGHPRETQQTLQDGLNLALELDVDFLQLNVMTPYPGTALFRELKESGRLLHEDYSRYGQSELVFRLDHLTEDDLRAFQRRAFRRFYLRPTMVIRQLRRLTKISQLLDLLKACYVVFISGLWRSTRRRRDIQAWNDFDLRRLRTNVSVSSRPPLLTSEVRQGTGLSRPA